MSTFIVLEGIDGAGTTTQMALLAEALVQIDYEVHCTIEPSNGPVGRLIRATLQGKPGAPDREDLPRLFAKDRAHHLKHEIEPALERGAVVICDRYVASSLAYQSLNDPFHAIWDLNKAFRAPDLLLFVDVSVEIALARIQEREGAPELFETHNQLVAVSRLYHTALVRLMKRGDRIRVVDGDASPHQVSQEVLGHVLETLEHRATHHERGTP
jgi:dTMP kinase